MKNLLPELEPHAGIIEKYFDLKHSQKEKFRRLAGLYAYWNERINLISRKDFQHLYLHHVLHSLAIAKFIRFRPHGRILDVGTGGGFPGVPLAILFPEVIFHLIDSTGKKIKAVSEIARDLELNNVTAQKIRVENHHVQYDFVISRAVTRMDTFVKWTAKNISPVHRHEIENGILYLKGGDLTRELHPFPGARIIPLSNFFKESFFETKKLIYLPEKIIKK